MAKQVIFDADVRAALKRGVDIVAGAVKVTLGPQAAATSPSTSRGAARPSPTTASLSPRRSTLADKFENMGAAIVKEVATKTNDKAGDGTTTAVVLTQAIISEGLKRTRARRQRHDGPPRHRGGGEGCRRGIEEDGEAGERQAGDQAGRDDLRGDRRARQDHRARQSRKSARTASSRSKSRSRSASNRTSSKEWSSTRATSRAYMVTNPSAWKRNAKDAPILITDKKISTVKEILPLLEKVAQIAARRISSSSRTMSTARRSPRSSSINCAASSTCSPSRRRATATARRRCSRTSRSLVGGQVISEDLGITFENAELTMLGRADARRRDEGFDDHRRRQRQEGGHRRERVAAAQAAA